MQHTIELSEDQLRELERLAAKEQRSVDELLQSAVGDYLVQRQRDWSGWSRRFDSAVAHIREGVPAGLSPEEIEAEITAARNDDRAEQAAAHRAAASGSWVGV